MGRGVSVSDGEIIAPVVGNDPASAMMRRRDDNKLRNYRALEEINTQPAITYLRDLYREKGKA